MLNPCSVVIGLTEHQAGDNFPLIFEAVACCRKMGFEIAVTDLLGADCSRVIP
jgi:hypothetical protein